MSKNDNFLKDKMKKSTVDDFSFWLQLVFADFTFCFSDETEMNETNTQCGDHYQDEDKN